MSKALRRLGVASREWEYNHGPWGDITRRENVRGLYSDIRRRKCRGSSLAPLCGTFSNALFWSGRLRSRWEPWGLSHGLTPAQREKVKAANRVVRAVIGIVKALHAAGLPWVVENPDTSLLWWLPFFLKIVDDPKVQVIKADHCRFRRPWKKRTRFICGNIAGDDLGRLSKLCAGSGGRCPHNSSGRHFQLQGQSPSGVLWTTLAAAYPTGMANAIAHALTAADLGRLINDACCY